MTSDFRVATDPPQNSAHNKIRARPSSYQRYLLFAPFLQVIDRKLLKTITGMGSTAAFSTLPRWPSHEMLIGASSVTVRDLRCSPVLSTKCDWKDYWHALRPARSCDCRRRSEGNEYRDPNQSDFRHGQRWLLSNTSVADWKLHGLSRALRLSRRHNRRAEAVN